MKTYPYSNRFVRIAWSALCVSCFLAGRASLSAGDGPPTFAIRLIHLAVAPALPTVGDVVKLRAIIKNDDARETANIAIKAEVSARDSKRKTQPVASLTVESLHPGEQRRLELGSWPAKSSGLYDLRIHDDLRIHAATQDDRCDASFAFAVVEHKVEFAWYQYHPPIGLRYPTMHLTIGKDEIADWLWEGRAPLVWKGGVCYWDPKCHPKASVEDQAKCWASIPDDAAGIAVDEWGEGDHAKQLAEVLCKFKAAHPTTTLALWNLPGQPYLARVKDFVDIFMPEVYLNYIGMHLGTLENSLRGIKTEGLTRKTLIGLGIDHDPKKGHPATTTPEELKAQMRLIKATTPDLLGVAFFAYASAPPGLAQAADEFCFRYFILPVIAVNDLKLERLGQDLKASVMVENIGNMTARRVSVERQVDGNRVAVLKVNDLPVGAKRRVSVPLGTVRKGFRTIHVRVLPSEEITPMDDEGVGTVAAIGVAASERTGTKRTLLYLPPAKFDRLSVPVRFALPQGQALRAVVECNSDGNVVKQVKAQQEPDGQVVWVVKAARGQPCFFAVESNSSPLTQTASRAAPEVFVFENDSYRAELDVRGDALRQLSPKPAMTNLFRDPWHLQTKMKQVFQRATIRQEALFTEVTVQSETDDASITSRYTFYSDSPVIELRRQLIPRRAFRWEGEREVAGFPQQGGFAQYFTGEGALRVGRSDLKDSNEYRDLYFGYLPSSPAPENHGKCGWFDFTWDEKCNCGLGVAIVERFIDSHSTTYDVSRYYDGDDRIEIFYDFRYGNEPPQATVNRTQESHLLLLPHGFVNLKTADSLAPVMPYHFTYRNPPRLCWSEH